MAAPAPLFSRDQLVPSPGVTLVVALTLAACLAGPLAAAASDSGLAARPLAARSGPRGATMFSTLPGTRTGVVTENNYADPRMWAERFQEFKFGAMGTGVAIGDCDGDGRPDVFVVSKTEQCRLFLNLGDWRFEDVTVRSGLAATQDASRPARGRSLFGSGDDAPAPTEAWNQGASFADIDNDGDLDLYVCRFAAPNWLFVNQGDGTFREEAAARGLALVDASGMAAFCDFDRDGWLDVFIQTNLLDAVAQPAGQPDHLFHNNGDGTFTDVTVAAGITGAAQGHSATWWDHDGDGWPDLYLANDFVVRDHLYRNNGDSTFTDVIDSVVPRLPHSSMGADLGDVNNDGRLDLLVADMYPTTREKDQRGLARIRGLLTDVDQHGPNPLQYMRNVLYVNTGAGRMLEAAPMAGLDATDWTWSVRLEDLDNDGRLDATFTNGMARELHNLDLVARISASETLAERTRLERQSPVLAEANLAFRNLGDLAFENVGAAWGLNHVGVTFGAAYGDLDGDGDLDLVQGNFEASAHVLRNDSDSGHRLVIALRGTASNRFGVGATARVDSASGTQVRSLVLARGYLSTSEPVLHFGLGSDPLVRRITVSWPSGHTQVFEDVAVDQHLTITEPDGPAPAKSVPRRAASAPDALFADVSSAQGLARSTEEKPFSERNQQPLIPVTLARRGPSLAVADVDGDGREEVLLGATSRDPARLLRRDASGTFSISADLRLPAPAPLDDGPILIIDVTGDDFPDLLLTRAGTALPAGAPGYQPRLWINDGLGAFAPAPPDALPPLTLSAGAVAAADIDRDGRLDIFLGARVLPGRYPLPPRSALLVNRGGRFDDVTDSLAPMLREPGAVTSALWTDADGDGWLDLLVALDWGAVRLFRNNAGHGFTDVSEASGFPAAGTGWWHSLAAADFNRDGRLDYVAGNLGLNTPYRATPERPALLFHGAFSTGNAVQLIDAFFEGDSLYPRRTRTDLAARIPALLKRFTQNDAFSRATLGEIVGEDRLAAARRFAATELRSGVFLSQPDGTWHFAPLPRIAQIAPLQGMVAGDFDGDSLADIYAVQNSHAAIPYTGRFDGGVSQLLRGDGRGGFTPVEPEASGLIVPGDAKALVVLDLDEDGAPDLLCSRNNSTTLAFQNHRQPDRYFLRVTLRGPAGNPTAIGAHIRLTLADGATQVAEVAAGSGYWSQSSPACFFGYTSGNPPQGVEVRWPSGASTHHDIPAGQSGLRIAAP